MVKLISFLKKPVVLASSLFVSGLIVFGSVTYTILALPKTNTPEESKGIRTTKTEKVAGVQTESPEDSPPTPTNYIKGKSTPTTKPTTSQSNNSNDSGGSSNSNNNSSKSNSGSTNNLTSTPVPTNSPTSAPTPTTTPVPTAVETSTSEN